ncbi:hypothetical protein K474DRAFT_1675997 [Panus rudis PR-1116 ss-1]|nr:hypothetical protein K474DRAFT_1675997 [Panus rudis PR-1116 ss-1]
MALRIQHRVQRMPNGQAAEAALTLKDVKEMLLEDIQMDGRSTEPKEDPTAPNGRQDISINNCSLGPPKTIAFPFSTVQTLTDLKGAASTVGLRRSTASAGVGLTVPSIITALFVTGLDFGASFHHRLPSTRNIQAWLVHVEGSHTIVMHFQLQVFDNAEDIPIVAGTPNISIENPNEPTLRVAQYLTNYHASEALIGVPDPMGAVEKCRDCSQTSRSAASITLSYENKNKSSYSRYGQTLPCGVSTRATGIVDDKAFQ